VNYYLRPKTIFLYLRVLALTDGGSFESLRGVDFAPVSSRLPIVLQALQPPPRGFRPVSPRSILFGVVAPAVKVLIRQLR